MRNASLAPEQTFDILYDCRIRLRLILVGGRELVGSVGDGRDIMLLTQLAPCPEIFHYFPFVSTRSRMMRRLTITRVLVLYSPASMSLASVSFVANDGWHGRLWA